MKKIIIFLMLLVTVPSIAQVRLGSSLDEIMSEFPIDQFQGVKDKTQNGDTFYAMTTDLAKVIYYFNEKNSCALVQIVPLSTELLNGYTQRYNSLYTVLSIKKWRAYLPEVIAEVSLQYPDPTDSKKEKSNPYFLWSNAE